MPTHEPVPPERCRERKRTCGVSAADHPVERGSEVGVIARECRQRILLRLANEHWLELRRQSLVPLSMPTEDDVLLRGAQQSIRREVAHRFEHAKARIVALRRFSDEKARIHYSTQRIE